ncbi:hypothetical protein [Stenotrophomonas sp. Iso1]|uniref:hypothetical protein n=1 Tax=Stenotrophomonas sp. Iso1 TaxID=2977283 RepID=UPI0022B7C534|nr:hypothetical protein [Stenotrophomonas sp. Iso1]
MATPPPIDHCPALRSPISQRFPAPLYLCRSVVKAVIAIITQRLVLAASCDKAIRKFIDHVIVALLGDAGTRRLGVLVLGIGSSHRRHAKQLRRLAWI